MTAYYNEIDPYAAQWLRNLIAAGHIAPGDVDERSITDVHPDELKSYTQCHFFAGIGVWSHALRSAGWDDSRPVWTGSCPCQPFSAAGKQLGTADERHLWPVFERLIAECRPATVFGEQVASAAGRDWLATVRADMEALDYAVGSADLCAAGVHAPHIRQRLYWVANANDQRLEGWQRVPERADERAAGEAGVDSRLADADRGGLDGHGQQHGNAQQPGQPAPSGEHAGGRLKDGGLADAMHAGWAERRTIAGSGQTASGSGSGGLADAGCQLQAASGSQPASHGQLGASAGHHGRSRPCGLANAEGERQCADGSGADRAEGLIVAGSGSRSNGLHDGAVGGPSTDHGGWRAADWLLCRDAKWRPVRPGTFPLVDGATNRVGRLRAYGNAIVPQVASAFIEVFLKCKP